MMNRIFLVVLFALFSANATPLVAQEVAADKARLTIVIKPTFKGRPLILSNERYINEHGDTLHIDVFKFYLSKFKFAFGGSYLTYDDAHLIDADSIRSLTFHVDPFPVATLTSISFTAGIDSVWNTNGANYGDLDPAKGMYWAWNTGYIMAKMEGTSKVCKTLHHAFEFHIGGYIPPFDASRVVNLQLPHPLQVQNGKNTIITISADASAWFGQKLNLAVTNTILTPGKEACMIADKYAKMFAVTDMKSE